MQHEIPLRYTKMNWNASHREQKTQSPSDSLSKVLCSQGHANIHCGGRVTTSVLLRVVEGL